MPDAGPFGETRFDAKLRAMLVALWVKRFFGGCVEFVLILATQRFVFARVICNPLLSSDAAIYVEVLCPSGCAIQDDIQSNYSLRLIPGSIGGNYLPRKEGCMPEKETLERAREDAREGKAPSTQAGEFVKEEMDHIREGKHGARSTKQAIAIGLSKARRAGVKLPPPSEGKTSSKTQQQASRDYKKGQSHSKGKTSARRSRAVSNALKKEGRQAASRKSLARQGHATAIKRGKAARHRSAMKAVRTKGAAGRSAAAQKAARTRAKAA